MVVTPTTGKGHLGNPAHALLYSLEFPENVVHLKQQRDGSAVGAGIGHLGLL